MRCARARTTDLLKFVGDREIYGRADDNWVRVLSADEYNQHCDQIILKVVKVTAIFFFCCQFKICLFLNL